MFEKLIKLTEISGTIAKANFIKEKSKDDTFMKVMQFLMDDLISTGIDIKKWNKVPQSSECSICCGNILEVLKYLKLNNTGKEEVVSNLKSWAISNHPNYFELLTKIFTELVAKHL